MRPRALTVEPESPEPRLGWIAGVILVALIFAVFAVGIAAGAAYMAAAGCAS